MTLRDDSELGRSESSRGADLALRLDELAAYVEGAHANHVDELEARDRAILEAIDSGCPRADVARWARVSRTRVTQIVAARAAELQAEADSRRAAAEAEAATVEVP